MDMQGSNISINAVLGMLTTLSNDNKKWLADRLYEQVGQSRRAEIDEAIDAAHASTLHRAETVEQLMADLMA